jgi:hypothetical protein
MEEKVSWFRKYVKPYKKAYAAAVTAFLGALGTAMVDNVVTAQEWVGIVSTTVAATLFVFGLRNAEEVK